MPVWRCPHCSTPQAEAARCWVCRRSTTSCATCRNFRPGVANGLGMCGLDPRRVALTGAEMRACWAAPDPVEEAVPGRSVMHVGTRRHGRHGSPAENVRSSRRARRTPGPRAGAGGGAGARGPARRARGRCGATRRPSPCGHGPGDAGRRAQGQIAVVAGSAGSPTVRSIGEPAAALEPGVGLWSGTSQLLSGVPAVAGVTGAHREPVDVDVRRRDLERLAPVVADVLGCGRRGRCRRSAWAWASGSAWGRRRASAPGPSRRRSRSASRARRSRRRPGSC